jgi:hypothetical protein
MSAWSDRRRFVLASALLPTTALTGCASHVRPGDTQKFIAEQSRNWTACYATGEAGVMERILAEDFVGTGPDGSRFNKQAALSSARQGPNVFASTTLDKVEVRLFGETAVVFGEDLLVFKSRSPAQQRTSWTDTWVYRAGNWQVVASHETLARAVRGDA